MSDKQAVMPQGVEHSRDRIFAEIEMERDEQDQAWGGPSHDDAHGVNDWVAILARHLGLAASDAGTHDQLRFRRQMVRVAAVAVAACEAFDRRRLAARHASPPPAPQRTAGGPMRRVEDDGTQTLAVPSHPAVTWTTPIDVPPRPPDWSPSHVSREGEEMRRPRMPGAD